MDHVTPPGAMAGRRRFWVTVLAFALANLAAWVGYHRYSVSRLHLLRVVKFEPGHAARVGARPTLAWEFNLDVAHDVSRNGGHNDTDVPGVITPHVAGKWLWHDGRTLTFTPEGDLPKATRFTVALNDARVRTREGIRLDQPFGETFSTAPLTVMAARQGGFDDAGHVIIELEFDDNVLPADVSRRLTIKDPEWKLLTFRPLGGAGGKVIRIQADAPGDVRERREAFVFVQLAGGLAGASGPLGTDGEYSTKVAVASDLMATEASAYQERRGEAAISLRFNRDDVDVEAVREVLSVEPKVEYQVTRDYRGVRLVGAFAADTRYAVKIAKPQAADGKKYPKSDVLSVFIPDRPAEVWFEHTAGYLGSEGNRTVMAHAINVADVNVTVTRLYDNNLVAWRTAGASERWDDPSALARPVASKAFKLAGVKNKAQDLRISLDELLPPDAPRDGVYRIGIAPADGTASERRQRYRKDNFDEGMIEDSASAVVTLSDIGLTAKQARDAVHVWAVSLRTAKPMGDVRLRLYSNKNQLLGETQTNGDGLATFNDVHPAKGERAAVILAEALTAERLAGDAQPAAAKAVAGRNLTWLDLRGEQLDFANFDVAGKSYLRNGYEAFVYTERGVYRPGETLHLRGIVRGAEGGAPKPFPVKWQLRRPDQRDWKAEVVTLEEGGGCALDIDLPNDLPTGRWTAELLLPGDKPAERAAMGAVSFQVEEFMPNRMKVAVNVSDAKGAKNPGRISVGDGKLVAEIQADYLFGKPVADRPATLTARVDAAGFSPANWGEWTFGDSAATAEVLYGKEAIGGRIELPETALDGKGHGKWELKSEELFRFNRMLAHGATVRLASEGHYAGPWRVTLYGAVTDAGGRAVNATRVVDVDRLPHYLGVRASKATFVPGAAARFDVAAVRPDGAVDAAGGECRVQLYRDVWNTTLVNEDGKYRYQSTRKLEAVEKEVAMTLSDGRGSVAVTPPTDGAYVVLVRDAKTGAATSVRFYATYGAWQDNVNREHPEQLEIVVTPPPMGAIEGMAYVAEHFDARMAFRLWHHKPLRSAEGVAYGAGQRAQAIVRAPFAGRLLLSIETDAVLWSKVMEMPASNVAVPIELPANVSPNAYVTATVVRAIDPNATWRTHRAFGVARLPVDNADRKLAVRISTPPELRPGVTLPVMALVTDAKGQPAAGAAVTVSAVDEGILSLTSFKTPDPFGFFMALRAHGVRWSDLYSYLMPEVARPNGQSPVGGDKDADAPAPSRHQTPVVARRVKPVAMITKTLRADEHGVVHADFAVPQFAGQLRVVAVAHSDRAFGSAEADTYVRSPLLVQSSWPRFAAPGDKFTVPLAVFNNGRSEGAVKIEVRMESANARGKCPLTFGDKGGFIKVETPVLPAGGQTVVPVEVVADSVCGVARVHLTATMNGESFAEDLELPVRPASPTVSIGGYAVAKPGEPAKIEMAKDFLSGTTEMEIRAAPFPTLELPRGIEYLDRYPYGCAEQTISGAFPLIALGDLGQQIAPGVFSQQRMDEKLNVAITRLIGMQTADGGISMWPGASEKAWPWASVYAAHFMVEAEAAGRKVPEDVRDHLLAYARNLLNEATDKADVVEAQAYACYVLALAGKPPRNVMSRLGEIVEHPNVKSPPSSQARFHLAAAWLTAGRRDLAVGLMPRTMPQPRAQRQLNGNLSSPVRDRAVMLSTLLAVDPENPAIPAMAQQIADAGKDHGWASTQDAAFAVMALGKYLRQMKPGEAYQSVALAAGDRFVAQSKGAEALATDLPIATEKGLDVRVTGSDRCQAYVSWVQSGVPLHPPADDDAGLKIRRRYLTAAGKPVDLSAVHSGDLVQVEVTAEATSWLQNVVIDDLLPAGLEVENARLATTADAGQVEGAKSDSATCAFQSRVDVRDDRVIAVGVVPAGYVAKFTYLARATTPGTFVVPPVRGECMYDIGTHSVSGAGKTMRILPMSGSAVADTE